MKSLKNYFLVSFIFFVTALLVLNIFPNKISFADARLQGEGTSENPYKITSVEDLVLARDLINDGGEYSSAFYVLENSLNLSDINNWEPIGNSTNVFSGTFDGNGKIIDGVNLNEGENNLGLFGVINNARILNLGVITNITLSETKTNGVFVPNSNVNVGGIVGEARYSTISGCYSKVNFSADRIEREDELYASKFSVKIDGTQKTSLSNVSEVLVTNLNGELQQNVCEIDNNYLSFNMNGVWRAEVKRNSQNQIYIAEVVNGETSFYLKSNLPSAIESVEVLNAANNVINFEDGKITFLEEGTFSLLINENVKFYAVVSQVEGQLQAEIFQETINFVRTTYLYQTFEYSGQVLFGGIVGELSDSVLSDCYSIPAINFFQEGNGLTSSYLGGIAGFVNNGEILNVYVAPTDSLVSEISTKNGNLNAITWEFAPIKINNTKTNSSILTFGGIVGYAKGGELQINNTMFFSLISSLNLNNIVLGGIVGSIPQNNSLWASELQYSKYLNLNNTSANIISFNSGVGNALDVGYVVNSSISVVKEMPTLQTFNSWTWNEFRIWDFNNVWKNISVIPQMGYYFPSLQNFAVITINVSGEKEIVLSPGGNYLSGYYTLEIEGVSQKSVQVNAGQSVTLIAKFYNENGNIVRDFAKYFFFTNWMQNGYSVANIVYGGASLAESGYTVELDETNGLTKITFIASSQTEGTYDVNIKGKPVKVNVNFYNQDSEQLQNGVGVVKKKVGAKEEIYSESFSFVINEYLNGEIISLSAEDIESGEFIFANKWEDNNLKTQTLSQRNILVELNNEQKTSALKFYPRVHPTSEGLVATLNVYYSSNTVPFNVVVGEGGKIQLNGTEYLENVSLNIISQSEVILLATPNEGMQFVGWFDGDKLISSEQELKLTLSQETTLTAKFEKIPDENNGLAPWIIGLIVGGCVVLVAGVIITIVVVKRRSVKSYKKNYRF